MLFRNAWKLYHSMLSIFFHVSQCDFYLSYIYITITLSLNQAPFLSEFIGFEVKRTEFTINPMRSVLPSADLFRRSRLSSATIKLFPVLNYVMSRPWLRARQLPRPRRKKKKTGKRLKHVSLCTQHHNLARKTWQNFLMNGWSNLCEQCLKQISGLFVIV